MKGTLCLSFDFELAWAGRRDSDYATHPRDREQTWDTVRGMLAILEKYEIPATWATVGAAMLQGPWKFDRDPALAPTFPWFKGDWYDFPDYRSEVAKCYYAPELIESILQCKTPQEVGCHTFTHILMDEPAVSPELLNLELQLCQEVASQWGLKLASLVFPRNMVRALEVLPKNGFRVYRGLNTEWYWFGHRFPTSPLDAKGLMHAFPLASNLGRLVDEKLRLTPPVLEPMQHSQYQLTKIQHSAFLPGFAGVSKYVSIADRIRRMEKGMLRTVEKGGVFSIYCHPLNLDYRHQDCMEYFEGVCGKAAELCESRGLRIMTMQTIADEVSEEKPL